jgi:hypothetical protein
MEFSEIRMQDPAIAPVLTGQNPAPAPPLLDRPALHLVVLDKYAAPWIA